MALRIQPNADKADPQPDADELIARHIEPGPSGRPDDTRLTDSGASVHAVIAYLRGVGGDVAEVARAYQLTAEAVQAAIAYYERHKAVIDARITLNSAAFSS